MEGIPPEDVKEHEKQKQGKQGENNVLFCFLFFPFCLRNI